MIGIVIGIAAVVGLISLGQGLQNAITEQFSAIGADKIFVQGKSGGFGPPGFATAGKVTAEDVKLLRKVPGVQRVAGRVFGSLLISFGDEQRIVFAASVPTDNEGLELIKEIELITIEDGRFLKTDDTHKVVIGANYAESKTFTKAVKVKNRIAIKEKEFQVVGIMRRTGDPAIDGGILLLENELRELAGSGDDDFNAIVVQVDKNQDPEHVAELIEDRMRKDRKQKVGNEDFNVQPALQLIQSFSEIFQVVQAVLVGIAAISLLVGGIGIMNTMYTSVLERTREIGIMKAIGAQKKDILFIMLIESAILGLMGGTLGILIGIGLAKGVELISQAIFGSPLIQAQISPELIIGALLFSCGIGMISGFFPARNAANLEPVDALRYE